MGQRHSLGTLVTVALVTISLATVSYGQGTSWSQEPLHLPNVMHICESHCSTWAWENGEYRAVPHGAIYSRIIIERFSREQVVMRRSDPPSQDFPQGLQSVYVGEMTNAGNKIINGTQTATFGGRGAQPFGASWGTALQDFPESDQVAQARLRQAQNQNSNVLGAAILTAGILALIGFAAISAATPQEEKRPSAPPRPRPPRSPCEVGVGCPWDTPGP